MAGMIYKLKSPDGVVHEFTNVQQFCLETGLEIDPVQDLLKGKIDFCQGWTRPLVESVAEILGNLPDKRKVYRLKDPDGVVHEFDNINEFARKHGFVVNAVNPVLKGWNTSYKGWTLPSDSDDSCYKLRAPDGVVHEFDDPRIFARQRNMNSRQVKQLLRGLLTEYKGWTLPETDLSDHQPAEKPVYKLKDKHGVIHEFNNIAEFERQNDIHKGSLSSVIRGDQKSYKGWTLPETDTPEPKKSKQLKDPDGVVHTFYNQAEFARHYGLHPASVSAVLSGIDKFHRGWCLPETDQSDYQPLNKKVYRLKDPDGVVHEFSNQSDFAKENKLSISCVSSVLSGRFLHCKGWCLPETEQKTYQLKDPIGVIHEFNNICKFERKMGVPNKSFYKVITGVEESYKGWTLPETELHEKYIYRLKDPDGVIHTFFNVRSFSRQNNLTSSLVYRVLSGKIQHHKGWCLPETELKTYQIKSPDDVIYTFNNRSKFAKEHNLSSSGVYCVLSGNLSHYKGWCLPETDLASYKTKSSTKKNINKQKKYKHYLKSPQGEIVGFDNINQFVKENGLRKLNTLLLLKGEQDEHKGWRRVDD